jgi:molybdate transport system substrate-binding protein
MRAVVSVLLAVATLAAEGCGRAPEPALLVFAAASLEDVAREAGRELTARTGVPVVVHAAGSGTLAAQVLAGAPADVVLSAGPEPVERLEAGGRVAAALSFAANELVVVVPRGSPFRVATAADLAGARRLAVADPDLAPAGRHAVDWLARAGLREALADRLVPLADVRAALAAVATGHADAGVVYATDAATSERVDVAWRVPRTETPDVRCVAVVVAGGREAVARQLVDFLLAPEGAALLARHGFVPRGAP